jgi:glucose/mannose-6-phosphate isomerase
VLMTLAHMGIIPDVVSTLDGTLSSLCRRRDALLADGSPAEEVARIIGRTIPLIYGSTGMTGVAARRWKTQVNENAKTPAFWAVQPELSHNEVAGWGQHGDVTRQVFSLITLRHAGEHPGVARRFARVIEATDEVMANVIPVWAEGEDDLSRFFDLSLFGDFVSLHMAGREGIDPGPTPALSDVEAAFLP